MLARYQASDVERVIECWRSASKVGHPFLSVAFLAAEEERLRLQWLPTTDTWVWAAQERCLGFISLLGDEVGGLFVDPAHHRREIGRTLLENAMQDRSRLQVHVFTENTGAQRFYQRCGFRVHSFNTHTETGFGLTLMRWRGDANALGRQGSHL